MKIMPNEIETHDANKCTCKVPISNDYTPARI